jgi:hypothetical protein
MVDMGDDAEIADVVELHSGSLGTGYGKPCNIAENAALLSALPPLNAGRQPSGTFSRL